MCHFLMEGAVYGVTADGTRTQIGNFRLDELNLSCLQCFKLGYPIVMASNRLLFPIHNFVDDTCKVEVFNERGEKLMEQVLQHVSAITDIKEERNVLFVHFPKGVHAFGIRNAKYLGVYEYWTEEEGDCVKAVKNDGTVVTLYDCARNEYSIK